MRVGGQNTANSIRARMQDFENEHNVSRYKRFRIPVLKFRAISELFNFFIHPVFNITLAYITKMCAMYLKTTTDFG